MESSVPAAIHDTSAASVSNRFRLAAQQCAGHELRIPRLRHWVNGIMTAEEIRTIQQQLGLSDSKMAAALGVTRQSFRNWRIGKTCPELAQRAMRWMVELRKLSPANDNLPPVVRVHL